MIQTKKPQGFAAMSADKVRILAQKGGRAAHAAGTAHQFTSDEARVAGRLGGKAPHRRRQGASSTQAVANGDAAKGEMMRDTIISSK